MLLDRSGHSSPCRPLKKREQAARRELEGRRKAQARKAGRAERARAGQPKAKPQQPGHQGAAGRVSRLGAELRQIGLGAAEVQDIQGALVGGDRKQLRRILLTYHPDKGGSTEVFCRVQAFRDGEDSPAQQADWGACAAPKVSPSVARAVFCAMFSARAAVCAAAAGAWFLIFSVLVLHRPRH